MTHPKRISASTSSVPSPTIRCAWIAVLLAACAGCRGGDLTIEYFEVEELDLRHDFSAAERRTIEAIANSAVAQVRAQLPRLPAQLTLRVHAGKDVIPETGESATSVPPQNVVWVVDPTRPGGVEGVANTWLRASLFHELHHLVRDSQIPRATMLDIAVTEGLATAFERDSAGATVPWGDYPAVVRPWVDELRANPDPHDRRRWLGRHPDGRRWVANKAGTYLARVQSVWKVAGRSRDDTDRRDRSIGFERACLCTVRRWRWLERSPTVEGWRRPGSAPRTLLRRESPSCARHSRNGVAVVVDRTGTYSVRATTPPSSELW